MVAGKSREKFSTNCCLAAYLILAWRKRTSLDTLEKKPLYSGFLLDLQV
jgi:hypothetical protein